MEQYIHIWCDYLLNKWFYATLIDYFSVSLAVILLGWFMSQMRNKYSL